MKKDFSKKLMVFLALGCLFLTACDKTLPDGTVFRVRIPIDDHAGHYSLQTVELHTITDINAMAGTTSVMWADGQFNSEERSDGTDVVTSAVLGTSPTAHFIDSGGVLHPSDFKSLAMTAISYHFESIKNFYDKIGGNEGLSFPRKILFNVQNAISSGSMNFKEINNAAYIASFDMFWVNPYDGAKVPLSFNPGVLAHEYLHSIFEARMKKARAKKMKGGSLSGQELAELENATNLFPLGEWADEPGNLPPTSWNPPVSSGALSVGPLQLNQKELAKVNEFVFGSINEGLADFFGYEYSRNPNFLSDSLTSQSFRDLSVDKNFDMTPEDHERAIVESFAAGRNGESNLDIHKQGAFFSRLLYLTAQDWGDQDTEQAVLNFMDNYAALYTDTKDKTFTSMGQLVQLFFKDRTPTGQLCDEVHRMFSGETFNCQGSSL